MLSYQHGFHAGNRADVLKHAVLEALLAGAPRRSLYVETHAGRGVYDLTGPDAQKLGEAKDGVLALLDAKAPDALKPWLARVATRGAGAYPGSPALALDILPDDARAVLFEMHPAEHAALTSALGKDVRVQIKQADGYAGALKLQPRTGEQLICLVDPSYETARDTGALADWAPRALRRWPRAQVALWLPHYRDGRERDLSDALTALPDAMIASAYWPVAAGARSSLSGTAMVLIGVPKPVQAKAVQIASALERIWRT